MHLTLHFLGENSVENVSAALRSVRMESFELTIEDVGCFEGQSRTSILWAGVRNCDSVHELHKKTAQALVPIGFRPETRPFKPHITLARCDSRVPAREIRRFLTDHADFTLPALQVDEFSLWSSVLTNDGPQYQCETTVPLSP